MSNPDRQIVSLRCLVLQIDNSSIQQIVDMQVRQVINFFFLSSATYPPTYLPLYLPLHSNYLHTQVPDLFTMYLQTKTSSTPDPLCRSRSIRAEVPLCFQWIIKSVTYRETPLFNSTPLHCSFCFCAGCLVVPGTFLLALPAFELSERSFYVTISV